MRHKITISRELLKNQQFQKSKSKKLKSIDESESAPVNFFLYNFLLKERNKNV